MTEQEWLASQDPLPLLDHLQASGLATDRKLRLFAVACSRRIWSLLDDWGRAAVELAELYADGLAGAEELRAARLACKHGSGQASWYAAASNPAIAARNAALSSQSGVPAEAVIQACFVRDIFGNPFRPRSTIEPDWLNWNQGMVVDLARVLYEERAFERMHILAEALAQASCQDEEILRHCRAPGPCHVRGCWAIDQLLRKE